MNFFLSNHVICSSEIKKILIFIHFQSFFNITDKTLKKSLILNLY